MFRNNKIRIKCLSLTSVKFTSLVKECAPYIWMYLLLISTLLTTVQATRKDHPQATTLLERLHHQMAAHRRSDDVTGPRHEPLKLAVRVEKVHHRQKRQFEGGDYDIGEAASGPRFSKPPYQDQPNEQGTNNSTELPDIDSPEYPQIFPFNLSSIDPFALYPVPNMESSGESLFNPPINPEGEIPPRWQRFRNQDVSGSNTTTSPSSYDPFWNWFPTMPSTTATTSHEITSRDTVTSTPTSSTTASSTTTTMTTKFTTLGVVTSSENMTSKQDVTSAKYIPTEKDVTSTGHVTSSESLTSHEDVTLSEHVTSQQDVASSERPVTTNDGVTSSEHVTSGEFVTSLSNKSSQRNASDSETISFPEPTGSPDPDKAPRTNDKWRTIVIAAVVPALLVAVVTAAALAWYYVLGARWKRHRRVDVEQPVANGHVHDRAPGSGSSLTSSPHLPKRNGVTNHGEAWSENGHAPSHS